MLIIIENKRPLRIRSSTKLTFFCSKAFESSGINVKDKEPISVDGKNSSGKVIPITIPYRETATLCSAPLKTSIAGKIKAMIG